MKTTADGPSRVALRLLTPIARAGRAPTPALRCGRARATDGFEAARGRRASSSRCARANPPDCARQTPSSSARSRPTSRRSFPVSWRRHAADDVPWPPFVSNPQATPPIDAPVAVDGSAPPTSTTTRVTTTIATVDPQVVQTLAASITARRKALAARVLLPGGAGRLNIEQALKSLLGGTTLTRLERRLGLAVPRMGKHAIRSYAPEHVEPAPTTKPEVFASWWARASDARFPRERWGDGAPAARYAWAKPPSPAPAGSADTVAAALVRQIQVRPFQASGIDTSPPARGSRPGPRPCGAPGSRSRRGATRTAAPPPTPRRSGTGRGPRSGGGGRPPARDLNRAYRQRDRQRCQEPTQ
jgi:hypothetical protein